MCTVTVLDTDGATLWFHPDSVVVHHRFKKPVGGCEIRELFEAGLEQLRTRRACKWLSDDRANYQLSADDGRWMREDWAPRAAAAGWKYWAMVLPKDVVATQDMQKYLAHGRSLGIDVQIFCDPILALAWLGSV
jgi:hypothetical protein